MRASFHSVHEPKCGICQKQCRYLESLREHLIGPLPKNECARIFSTRGCDLCSDIFRCPSALRIHRGTCQLSCAVPGLISRMSRLSFQGPSSSDHGTRMQGSKVIALGCTMVGGGSDGSLDLCARVFLIGEDENIIFQTYIKPLIPVTNYSYGTTGVSPEHLSKHRGGFRTCLATENRSGRYDLGVGTQGSSSDTVWITTSTASELNTLNS
ncbi:unnamed protein product [Musa hybrid cultivar]